jgi:hypothetical protein
MIVKIINKILLNLYCLHGIRAFWLTPLNISFFMASSSPNITFPIINHLISVKLEGSNYLCWLSQFLPILRGNDLLGIVDGS